MQKRTNIELDVELLKEAMELSKLPTIKEVVHESLREMIKRQKSKKLLKLRGKVNWEGELDEMRSL
ncbi:MAG: type II toxin-antitoxin system VapB family antitoxin [Bacteroidota bacterium]